MPFFTTLARITVFSNEYCVEKVDETGLLTDYSNYDGTNELPPDVFCAGMPDADESGMTDTGSSLCSGDFGSPMICNRNGRATVVGTASGIDHGCGSNEGKVTFFGDTYSNREWIINTILENGIN